MWGYRQRRGSATLACAMWSVCAAMLMNWLQLRRKGLRTIPIPSLDGARGGAMCSACVAMLMEWLQLRCMGLRTTLIPSLDGARGGATTLSVTPHVPCGAHVGVKPPCTLVYGSLSTFASALCYPMCRRHISTFDRRQKSVTPHAPCGAKRESIIRAPWRTAHQQHCALCIGVAFFSQ